MAHADPLKDPYIWTDMEKLSGHRLAIMTPLNDHGPWSKDGPGTGRRSWLFVGLRDQSGIVDVARVEGPMFTAGITRPQDGAILPQQAAILAGQSVGADNEIAPRGRIASFLDRTVGARQDLDNAEISVHPIANRATRQAALNSMDPEHVALFGAAIRDHHRLSALVDQFEGPTRNADVRNPGTIDALNLANGVYQQTDGTLFADPQSPWAKNTDDGTLQLLEIAAIKGKIEPLLAVQTPLAIRGALATSLAGYAMANLGDDTKKGLRIISFINDVAGADHIHPETRLTLATNAGWLSERPDTVDELLAYSDKPLLYTGPALKADTLAAAARMALAVDAAVGAGSYRTQEALVQAPLSVVDKTGGQMLDLEARVAPDPIPHIAQQVKAAVVLPAVEAHEKAIPSLRGNALWVETTQDAALLQRAQAITVGDGMLSLGNIPIQIANAQDGARAVSRQHPNLEEAQETFRRTSMRNPVDHTGTFQEGAIPRAARAILDDPAKLIAKDPKDRVHRPDDAR